MSASSSSSSKPRNSSPFRFHKPASVNGRLPGHSPSGPSPFNKSITPGRARSLPPPTPPPPQMLPPSSPDTLPLDRLDVGSAHLPKENVTVTVRFRPLSSREIQKGDEIAWYADGETTVRSEYNAATSYAFDRVFGPATTTRNVYDVAARHVVNGAMRGVNGTVFAYGVTSSGKTHTMHGDQKSPGIIPLAVKEVFSTIQETPGREFLLRVSYLEIYNEVINDLLDPAGQNLRVREDAQGTYVEGIKEEVVLSPAHCLSLIATGEEHRHVGSNNFNLLSSRSHTIFTLTIESSPRGDNYSDEEVTLSQLNLIDLAGSESSKTETTGLRRKEGAYINKSLLTLGTVISKLTDGKATHVPYRDSKLTRLLQSSLSGHGRVSLICTVTPSSSSTEETHNTIKFAHRAKHVEIHASQNKIIDEKSLIKKYQKEIQNLKHELEQVKRRMVDSPYTPNSQEDLASLKQQLEAGKEKLMFRLEEEEQAKAALLGRIQRLTKLILVSTKTTAPQSLPERQGTHRRRHSFGEEELAYLPDRRRDFTIDDEDGQESEISSDGRSDNLISDDPFKGEKKLKRRSMLAWFKSKKNELGNSIASLDTENSSNTASSANGEGGVEFKSHRNSVSRRVEETSPFNPLAEATLAGELFSATLRGRKPPPTGTTMADQMDLLREQVKMLGGEVALCTSSLKRLSEQVASNPNDSQLQMQMQNLKDEIQEKKRQMRVLERRILGNAEPGSNNANALELSQTISKLTNQLNEKSFELELKSADNRILQEQLQSKVAENTELQNTIAALRQQFASKPDSVETSNAQESSTTSPELDSDGNESGDTSETEVSQDGTEIKSKVEQELTVLQGQVLQQADEIEKLKQEKDRLVEEKDALHIQGHKLAEESAYAKELASAAAVELKNLAEEVTKLSYQNSKLAAELATAQELAKARNMPKSVMNGAHLSQSNSGRQRMSAGSTRRFEEEAFTEDLRRELLASKEREAALEAKLAERELKDLENQKKMEEAKKRETDLENDLAGMWVLVAKLKKARGNSNEGGAIDIPDVSGFPEDVTNMEGIRHSNGMGLLDIMDFTGLKKSLEKEKQHSSELEKLVAQLKSEDLDGLDLPALEDLSALHVQALTRLCQAKANVEEKLEKERESMRAIENGEDDRNAHVCKVCFEAPAAAVLLPCRHFSLCKSCAVACTECPLCRTTIQDRIITFTS
uniref:Kinesin 7-Ib protein n=1 Tax=Marsilea vestita TaxID=59764 RepID=A0A142KW99_MARVE|nr:kinesin 7-Ib protein [Marsilea vestita]